MRAAMVLAVLIGSVTPAWGQVSPGGTPGAAGALSDRIQRQAVEVLQRTDLVVEGIEWVGRPVESKERGSTPEVLVMESARLRVTVRNAGTKRWASAGRVAAVVRLGTPEELDTALREETRRAGLGLAQSAREDRFLRTLRLAPAPFGGEAGLPGSLGPGERRTVEITLQGLSGQRDSAVKLLMAADKYYTAQIDLQVSGDDEPKNNGADLTFRLHARGGAVEPQFRLRSTDPAQRGSVEVLAPRR